MFVVMFFGEGKSLFFYNDGYLIIFIFVGLLGLEVIVLLFV